MLAFCNTYVHPAVCHLHELCGTIENLIHSALGLYKDDLWPLSQKFATNIQVEQTSCSLVGQKSSYICICMNLLWNDLLGT